MVDGLSPATLVATGALIAACSGIPGVLLRQAPGASRIASVIAILAASAFGLTGSFIALTSPPNQTAAPSFATLMVDPLSACFLIPLFIVSSCCAVYSIGYWPANTIKNSAVTTFFFGLLIGAIALVITARTALVFLVAWEVMALGAFFSLSAEHEKAEVREAGRLYLITSHTATLALFAMFALLKIAGNSAAFPLTASLAGSTPLAAAIFITGLFGFGVKAGIMPLHIWLPSAHAGAPSHISALMSGVLIKTGIYGIIRITSFFVDIPLWWGTTVILLGIASAVAGVAFAIGQHDLKRLLAYHSIENVGIIVMGVGMALIGVSTAMPVLTLLGMAGALLHVINHALFKSLLFLCAGSVVHATGTREIDLLGGLSKKMPRTAGLFLLGSVAICGLPPLNGFVSEFLLYIGFFNGIRSVSPVAAAATAVAAPSLALVGGLAVACFVKVYGATFLGFPRTESIQSPHEAGHVMVVPMAFLGLLCVAIGVFPTGILGILQPAVASWRPGIAPDIAVHAPVAWISLAAGVLLTLILVLFFLVRRKTANAPRTVTWDCGYLRPAASMQYTSSSFAEMIVKLFAGILRPERHDPAVKGLFPKPAKFSSHVPEAVMEVVLQPAWHRLQTLLGLVRHLQHGQIPLYILYIFVTLVCLLVWGAALTPGTNFGG